MSQPNPAMKGVLLGNCNRQACQQRVAFWYNHGTRLYYCTSCAQEINYHNPEALAQYGHPLCVAYIPVHLHLSLNPLPPLDHEPTTAAELIRQDRWSDAMLLLTQLGDPGTLYEQLKAILDLPYTNLMRPGFHWEPNATGVAEGSPEWSYGFAIKSRPKPEFRDLIRAYPQQFQTIGSNTLRV